MKTILEGKTEVQKQNEQADNIKKKWSGFNLAGCIMKTERSQQDGGSLSPAFLGKRPHDDDDEINSDGKSNNQRSLKTSPK